MSESLQGNSAFPATQWTAVVELQKKNGSVAAGLALEELCKKYWQPLYSYARKIGYSQHDAQDLTQGFFSYVVNKELFSSADREIGRLRTFLLTTFSRYIFDIKDYQNAAKRGGTLPPLSLDASEGEEQYAGVEPRDAATPESEFERNWALTVLQCTLREVAAREKEAGHGRQFEALEPFLSIESACEKTYAEAAGTLRISEESVRQAVHRLRLKFRKCLREQIAQSLANPTEELITEEMSALRDALRR